MPTPARRRRRATRAVGGWAKRLRSGDDVYARAETPTSARECMRAGENACAQATTHAPGRQCLRPCNDGWRVGGVLFHKHPKLQRSCNGVCARATTPAFGRRHPHAHGRQRVRPGNDVCARATTGAAWEGCFFTNTSNFNARATTSASGRQRLHTGDDVRARATMSGSYCPNVGIFFCFGNPNKTFPLSLFENYSNCVEDGNPKLFLLVRVFLSALNHDLAFLSRHLSI